MKICPACGRWLSEQSRFCTACGRALSDSPADQEVRQRAGETLNLPVLYAMIGLLILALAIPPWETPPDQPPAFLGFGFFWAPPVAEAAVSRLLLTIELTTLAVAGLYFSWLFRKNSNK
jgi:hypothetical protein